MELLFISFLIISFMMLCLGLGMIFGKVGIKSTCAQLNKGASIEEGCISCSCHKVDATG